MKIVVVGGVAGGASAACRARRLDPVCEIVLFEKGGAASFANCGLPYHVGKVIPTRDELIVASRDELIHSHRLDVRLHTEVMKIDREKKEVVCVENGEREYTESYDKLVLAPGAAPIIPPIPGVDLPNVCVSLKNLEDMDKIMSFTNKNEVQRVCVVGAGYIGVELVENLVHIGKEVFLVEMLDQILSIFDPEIVTPITRELEKRGVHILTSERCAEIEKLPNDDLIIKLASGKSFHVGLVVLAIGVKPNDRLAREAGIECDAKGGILVNEHMLTSDDDIYAVGDVVVVNNPLSGNKCYVPLAGPANRQGRIAADNICGIHSTYRGTIGTSVLKTFDKAVGGTGLSERQLKIDRRVYSKIYVECSSNASYYPGSERMALKVLFNSASGRLLGAQIVGSVKSTARKTDVFSMAILGGMTVSDLEHCELAYSPQFGSAKDVVNMIGFVGVGMMRGFHRFVYSSDVFDLESGKLLKDDAFVVDVREKAEYDIGHFPDAVHIPLGELDGRLSELPRDKEILICCRTGIRAYEALRLLEHHKFKSAVIAGGFECFEMLFFKGIPSADWANYPLDIQKCL